jgi:tetratricopeptide (TPR) repeat protein
MEAWRQQQGTQRARIPERRQNLQDRLENVDREQWQKRRDDIRKDRQNFREGRREDWQQHREGAREDWQNWYDDRYYYHYSWHHGCWHDGWHGYWDHMWDEHPVAVAFGLTCWGANTMAYMFGTTDYSNPYYAGPVSGSPTDYSQPQINVQQSIEAGTESELPQVPDDGIRAFEEARSAFHTGNYDEALRLTDDALKHMPHDAVVHEFRALILFAHGRYMEAAAVLHSVLAVGPGWDWTTMSQLYHSIEDYTAQLRALEAWTKERPALPDGHFVLAYHYMTCGHRDDAVEQLRVVVKALPDDTVSARILNLLTGETPAASSPADVEQESPALDRPDLNADQLTGTWTANKDDATFTLDLKADARFTWTFEERDQSQSVSGVYALDGSTLAMEPDSGGAMLAELRLDGTKLSFQQVGAPADDAILVFERK